MFSNKKHLKLILQLSYKLACRFARIQAKKMFGVLQFSYKFMCRYSRIPFGFVCLLCHPQEFNICHLSHSTTALQVGPQLHPCLWFVTINTWMLHVIDQSDELYMSISEMYDFKNQLLWNYSLIQINISKVYKK